MPKKKQMSEKETRANIMRHAKRLGCEGDIQKIFDKYDRALKNCTNEMERKHIAHVGAVEIHKYLSCRGALVVDGVELLPASDGKEEDDVLI